MTPIRVEPDLWATSLLPEGMIEKWLLPDGAFVEAGESVAALRIEGALHEIFVGHEPLISSFGRIPGRA